MAHRRARGGVDVAFTGRAPTDDPHPRSGRLRGSQGLVVGVALSALLVAGATGPQPHAAPAVSHGHAQAAQLGADQVAFVSDRGHDADIYLTSLATGAVTNLTGDLTAGAQDAGPTWSPDGNRMAFASTREGTWDLFVLSLPEMRLQRLTRSPGTEFDPAWSPDGAAIAFERTKTDGSRVLSVMSAGGGPIRDLINDGATDLDPAWTPEGKLIFESDRAGSYDTWTIDPQRGAPRPLASGAGEKFHAASSPDGSRLAYERGVDNGNYNLYVFDGATRQATAVAASQAEDAEPAWSPEGGRLAFVTSRDGQYEIYTLDLGTATATRITRSRGADDIAPAWRPSSGARAAIAAYPRRRPVPAARAAAQGTCTRYGTDRANTMNGGNGADTLCGRDGNDKIYGHRGSDRLVGDPGRDRLFGQDGADHLFGGGNGGGKGTDRLRGGAHSDHLYARGDKARDCLWGNSGAADWARIDLGTKSWSDNRNPAPWGGNPCGQKSTIEAWD